jgi:hypothetical protein
VPGAVADPAAGNDAGWQPVSFGESARAFSHVYGREPAFALDLNPQTWWEAREDDALPWIETDLYSPQSLRALRLHWKEPGLDYDGGAGPRPMRWRLLGRAEAGAEWTRLIDRGQNTEDWLIEYHELPDCPPLRHLRLELSEAPGAVGVGLIDFTLFAEIRLPE